MATLVADLPTDDLISGFADAITALTAPVIIDQPRIQITDYLSIKIEPNGDIELAIRGVKEGIQYETIAGSEAVTLGTWLLASAEIKARRDQEKHRQWVAARTPKPVSAA